MKKYVFTLLFLTLLSFPATAFPEESSVPTAVAEGIAQVQSQIVEFSKAGNHFQALSEFLEENKATLNLVQRVAAAKSAWALGLVSTARDLWEQVLSDKDFQGPERKRTMLSQAILELQESRYDRARAIAEEAVRGMDVSDLQTQFFLVIAEALKEQGAINIALPYYKKAMEQSSEELRNEAMYLFADAQMKLGMLDEARYNFASIDTSARYAARALQKLIEIDLSQFNYDGVLAWLEEGRSNYAEEFQDAWSSYAFITALLELGKEDEAKKELKAFRARYSADNQWFILADAAMTSRRVQEAYPRARLQKGTKEFAQKQEGLEGNG